jgi:DHA1 family tetracycline resistance protein-like MFS transporter
LLKTPPHFSLTPPAVTQKRNAALIFIFITLLIDVIGIGIIIPVVPKLIQQMTGGTVSDASRYGGWLLFAYSAMQFVFSPVLGGLSDQYGRRPVLLASLFGFGLDYIVVAFAPSIGWLFVARLIAGITGASFTTAGAYIADVSAPQDRAKNFGIIGAAFGLGFIIGPSIGGLLGQYGPRVPFMAAAGFTLLNWLYGYFILPESLKPENRRPFDWRRANPIGSLANLRRYPVILSLVATFVCIYIAAHATQSTWTYYTIEKFKWNEKWVGYSLSFVGLMAALVQGGLTRVLIPKIGAKRAVFVGLACYTVGFMCFALATQAWMMFAFTAIYSLGGLAGPSLQGIISSQVPANEQGELQGGLNGLLSVTSIVGPVLMTGLFSYFTGPKTPYYFPGAPFAMGTLLMLLSLVLVVGPLRRMGGANG